jgi:hypothetical protein
MLLWYFVKTSKYPDNPHYTNSNRCDGLTSPIQHIPLNKQSIIENPVGQFTDAEYEYGPLPKGMYGDVPVYFNRTSDNKYASKWRRVDGGIYLHNSKTYWQDNSISVDDKIW